jgi:hypothetical protein
MSEGELITVIANLHCGFFEIINGISLQCGDQLHVPHFLMWCFYRITQQQMPAAVLHRLNQFFLMFGHVHYSDSGQTESSPFSLWHVAL